MANRLADETSPYLRQHADNPVDWYPWGEEALERANQSDKPIFLSIGYSACHWCHVMEHESFEDEETAALMNQHFVNIKVDREERPDLDAIYMSAVQAISGSGGWPMSMFLLPDGRPFYGGTYFPKTARYGMPSFQDILKRVAAIYHEKREALERDAGNLTSAISRTIRLDSEQESLLSPDVLEAAFQSIASSYDAEWGGFGSQPKFPPSMTLELLFRLYQRYGWKHALEMATHTLDRMARGGMHDQLGGGFHRYSVDRFWLVPHFEKMLYDNALLIRAYLHAYQITGEVRFRRVVESTVRYIEREMTDSGGGFYSSQDADSEGEEGKFFVWEEGELPELLASHNRADVVLDLWGVTSKPPNFEGRYILWLPDSPEDVAARHGLDVAALDEEVDRARQILLPIREARIKPGPDEKVLAAWNGLMIKSLAEAGRVLGRADYIQMASRSATFVLTQMLLDGRLLRSYKDGRARFTAYLEDYALMGEALIELYESTFELHWFEKAVLVTEAMVSQFWDDEAGFYDTSQDHESLIARPQELTDNAIPSGTSSAVAVLLRMAILADRPDWRERAERILTHLVPAVQQYPSAFSYLACQLDFALSSPHEVALVGDPGDERMRGLLAVLHTHYRPNQVTALLEPGNQRASELIPLLAQRSMVDNQPTAYVCHNFVCKLPVTTPDALQSALERGSDN